jgi:effector-binding domain-containing protein
MLEEPKIVQTSTINTAVIHFVIPRSELRSVMGPAHLELMQTLAAQGIALAGPWFTHHNRLVPNIFDFQLGVPVTSPVTPKGRVNPGQLPGTTVAKVVWVGGYEGLGAAWSKFGKWIAANGHKPGPNFWESYVVGPELDRAPMNWRTELNRPIISVGKPRPPKPTLNF